MFQTHFQEPYNFTHRKRLDMVKREREICEVQEAVKRFIPKNDNRLGCPGSLKNTLAERKNEMRSGPTHRAM